MLSDRSGNTDRIGHPYPSLVADADFFNDSATANLREQQSRRPVGGAAKRSVDIVLALCALLALLPAFLLAAFLVWRYDGGRILFGHSRIGWGGRSFRCLKFRSMVPDAKQVLTALLARDASAAQEWDETQKLRDDPRVTPIGQILRVTSLDELPQLLNVLSGQMSIIGPRPIVDDEVARYGKDIASYRACRPGITGLWQVSGRSDCGYTERVALDVRYATGWSLWLDAKILAKTVVVVLARKGSC